MKTDTKFVQMPLRDLPESVLNLPDVDPYMVWADASGFVDYQLLADRASTQQLVVTAELVPGCKLMQWQALLSEEDITNQWWTGTHRTYLTAHVSWATCQRLLTPKGRAVVARFEIGLPWRDQRPDPTPEHQGTSCESGVGMPSLGAPPSEQSLPWSPVCNFRWDDEKRPSGAPIPDLWIVVDDGCPFARSDLRRSDGGTRLRSLWYQDEVTGVNDLNLRSSVPLEGYGRRWGRQTLDALLKHWGHDAAACYAHFGDPRLARRSSHGAHVLSLLHPSSSSQATEPDMVFVQLPRHVASTVSRSAIAPLVLDGVAHGLQEAEPGGRAVAMITMEAYDGPHDGSSLFEAALQAMIESARQRGVELQVVMAAGNAHQRSVVQGLDLVPGRATECVWRVPPDSERSAWMEMWFPGDDPLPEIRVAAPGHAPGAPLQAGAVWAWPSRENPVASVILLSEPRAGGRLVVLRLAPTNVVKLNQIAAPCGDWRVVLTSSVAMRAHAYLARCWQAPRERQRARQGRLRVANPFGAPEARLEREPTHESEGSISGLACGGADITVVGSCLARSRYARAQPVGYSGRGPARGGWRARLGCTEVLAPGEESAHLHGLRAQGHLEGSSTRMGGTSMAVPMYARTLKGDGEQDPPAS